MTAMRFIFPLAKRLSERGNLVEFASGPGEGLKDLEESGFPFTLLSMDNRSSSIGNLRVFKQLKDFIAANRYDVVHTYTPVMGFYGRLAAFRAKTPVVVHSVIGSLLASGVPFFHRVFYFVSELTTSRLVDLFITLNEADARTIVNFGFASKSSVSLLKYEYGVDLHKFDPASVDRDRLANARRELHLPDGIPVIGFIGRMIGAKGILDLFDAFVKIRLKGVRVKLMYLGDVLPSVKDRRSLTVLKNRVKQSGFEDDVLFLGWREDVPFYLSLMDVVVLPSHYEGFPRIPIEAGAMSKPSISTATSAAEIAVEHGVTGLIVPIKDPMRLAEAIQKIIVDPSVARAMGNAARQRVVKLFDQDVIVGQQVRIYEDFFKTRKGKPTYHV
jgi:glycosyltransferase involved in cell wall biosynthesis